jgi:CBS domain-containing protein
MSLRESLNARVSNYMSQDYARIDSDDSVAAAAREMEDAGVTEALVLRGGAPVGIVTERDILYKVVAKGLAPTTIKVGDIMSSPVKTIDEASMVAEAIAEMTKLGIRRLGVTSKGKIVGMVTQKAMVSGRVQQNVPLPELVPPGAFACPYCNSVFQTVEELSKHIDHAHLGGPGLLQGGRSKW